MIHGNGKDKRMKFFGLQKMTLLDYPGKVACTVFTGGCNFRCPFCHNALLVTEIDNSQTYDEEEIISFLKTRRGLLDGVCVTGGEPLLHPSITGFIGRVKSLGFAVKLDTNGSFPDTLADIIDAGLVDKVAMDIKNSPDKYGETVGLPDFDVSAVRKSISLLLEGRVPYEFRTTVVRELHTVEDIAKIAEIISGAREYYLQNFVDSGNLISSGMSAHPKEVLEEMKNAARIYVPSTEIRGI